MKRFLLDLFICRSCDKNLKPCKTDDPIGRDILAWREASEFTVHCRKCHNAPCIASCPYESLYWENGMLVRNAINCSGCGSCSLACPFGVILTESTFPEVSIRHFNFETAEMQAAQWLQQCPKEALRFGDFDADPRQGIVEVFPWLLTRGRRWEPESS